MTTNSEPDNGTSRDDLVERIELMEAMIAEGRQTTMRCGWIFILWGLVDLAGMGWQMVPGHSRWVWPVCLVTGVVLQVLGLALRKGGNPRCKGIQSRSVEAVWLLVLLALIVYVGTVQATHFAWQFAYMAAILILVGLAHAISAAILRWRVQAVAAAIWWAGAVAILVRNSRRATNEIFLIEMCFGMIAFGLYVIWLERRDGGAMKGAHA